MITSGQRTVTKGRIAATHVTHAVGESISKPRLCRDAPLLWTNLQPCAASGICCLHSIMHFNGGTTTKMAPSLGHLGPHLIHGSRVHNPTASRSVHRFCRTHAYPTDKHRQKHTHTHTQTTLHLQQQAASAHAIWPNNNTAVTKK